jgi:hypothetical protein
MRHMIRHECVGDTPWSRGNAYMRTDIYGTSVLVADSIQEASYINERQYIRHECVGDR